MSDTTGLRVLVVDDHLVIRNEVRRLVEATGAAVVGEAGTLAAALRGAADLRPDLIVLDLDLPDGSALDAIPELRRISEASRILVLTVSSAETDIRRALAAGATGYLTKDLSAAAVASALSAVASGVTMVTGTALDVLLAGSSPRRAAAQAAVRRLTSRELQILRLLASGESAAGVAARLDLSVRTVEGHARAILARLRAKTRAEAVRILVESGLDAEDLE